MLHGRYGTATGAASGKTTQKRSMSAGSSGLLCADLKTRPCISTQRNTLHVTPKSKRGASASNVARMCVGLQWLGSILLLPQSTAAHRMTCLSAQGSQLTQKQSAKV